MANDVSEQVIDSAIELAAQWQHEANAALSVEERRQQGQMARLLAHPTDKVVLAKLFDQSFRSRDPVRVADQMDYLLKTHGIPVFFTPAEKTLVLLFRGIGRHLPSLSIPRMIAKMRTDSRQLIIAGERQALHRHLERRKAQGISVNLNHLGEAVLGEEEAALRLDHYLKDLEDPLVECISVKISTIYSQIRPLAFEHCVEVLCERLNVLYRHALSHTFELADGTRVSKLVNLDMEAYGDFDITVAAFKRTLERPEFVNLRAGVVLQAYLPEAYTIQQELTAWACRRTERGGSPIKIRIVKGANLEMERIDAALHNWPLAPYSTKSEVDANYKRMLIYGLAPDHIRSVNLGVASHNLFELAFAHQLAKANDVETYMAYEMLEGMANHVVRVLAEQGHPMLLYAPVAGEKEFINSIAYLIRRMDENTGPENFMRHIPGLTPRSGIWKKLQVDFKNAFERIDHLDHSPRRVQNRKTETWEADTALMPTAGFVNEIDTDWALDANRQWAADIRRKWQKTVRDEPAIIPLVVAGQRVSDHRSQSRILDPNALPEEICVARYQLATIDDIDRAVKTARTDSDSWRRLDPDRRREIFSRVAQGLRKARGDLIGAAAANTGKVFYESDPEVSEAIDFVEYYPRSMEAFLQHSNLSIAPKGVGVVISPWNFPIAIACGGISAALATGNSVIFKPSSQAVLVAWHLCQVFWEAGVSKNTLQFLPCNGAVEGSRLVEHPEVDFVILTGGTETGLAMLKRRPDLFLAAETGGKNATIITAMADRDQAIEQVVQSAFGHGGQKCSATSLLILEKEVYNDPGFKRTLVDATRSLAVGSAWKFRTAMGPLIQPPSGALLRGLTQLEPGESWALKPRCIEDNPRLWTPGIKWNVSPGSFTHITELFGPVLGVMSSGNLEEAIDLANATGYGLTSGLQSLDPREIQRWKAGIRAGNLYINRGTTGAVVLRQPFGGMAKSAIGPAIKAGGPHYVSQFIKVSEKSAPFTGPIPKTSALLALAQEWEVNCRWGAMHAWRKDVVKSVQAVKSYLYHAQTEFLIPQDYVHLRGQDNQLRHVPVKRMAVCLHPDDSLFEVIARLAAAIAVGCRPILCRPKGLSNSVTEFLDSRTGRQLTSMTNGIVEIDGDNPLAVLPRVDRLRYADARRVSTETFRQAAEEGIYIARAPVVMDGRIELLHYLYGQSICHTYHRYGNLGERGVGIE